MKKERSLINKRGFSLVETLVAISVFLVFVLSTVGVITNVSQNSRHAANGERAAILAEESLEVARNLRDANPAFATLPDGTYGLSASGNQWNLSGSSDSVGIFTRSVTITTVSGSQKKVTASVSWPDQTSQTNSVVTSTYLTDWRAPLNIGLTVNKSVVNHGGTRVAGDFLPVDLTTLAWDNSVDPPVQNSVNIPIIFSPSTMTLGPNTYTFLTSNDPSYSVNLSSECGGNSITLNDGDAKLCNITYEEYTPPTVTTPTHISVTGTTATLGANVTSLGNPASISARGTCWATSPSPTTNCLTEGGTTTGVFSQARTGFTAGTTYYYRGYATNSFGTGYSTDGTFTTATNGLTAVGTPTTYDSSGSLSATVSKPTGVSQNDIMFAYIGYSNALELLNTVPSGWILVAKNNNGSNHQALYYKVAGVSEPGSYTFGFSLSVRNGVTISAFRGGFDPSNPIDVVSNTQYTVNNTTYRSASMNFSFNNENVIVFPSVLTSGSRTFSAPLTQGGGWSTSYVNGNASSQFSRSAFYKTIPSSGATGVIDSIGSVSGTTNKHSFAVGLKP